MSIFTRIIAGDMPASIVYRDDRAVAFMDIHPIARGHVLVCPLQAVATLDELDPALRGHLHELALKVASGQRKGLGSLAQHFLVNDGRDASQTVPHVHIHVIPRYGNDSVGTMARIIAHLMTLGLPLPITSGKRRRLDQQADAIAQSMPDLQA